MIGAARGIRPPTRSLRMTAFCGKAVDPAEPPRSPFSQALTQAVFAAGPHVKCRAPEYNRADLSNSNGSEKCSREAGCDYRVAVRLDFSRLVLSCSFICR